MLVQGVSGMMYLTGRREDPPLCAGAPVVDTAGGLNLALGILAGVLHARQTGQGQIVEIDLLGCALAAQQQELTVHLNHPVGDGLPRAEGNIGHVGATAPYGIYAATDGFFSMAMFPCSKLAELLDLPWLGAYDTNEAMFANRDVIYRGLAEHFSQRPREELLALLRTGGVWCAPVFSYAEMEADAHVRHVAPFWDVPVGEGSDRFRTVGSPFTFSRTPARIHRGVPRLGENTAEVLGAG
jgi:crotonobetainyl-CoA:carnitine CoA-transferase CaiB-like acyl-CoA transferase